MATGNHPRQSPEEQALAYRYGYRDGCLVRNGTLAASSVVLAQTTRYPDGSWADQYTRGYHDGVRGKPCVIRVAPSRSAAYCALPLDHSGEHRSSEGGDHGNSTPDL